MTRRLAAMLLLLAHISAASAASPPNVVCFLADDQGWNDVGYHGSEIQTPTIDRLAREGVKLEQFYAMPLCTPTRAALLTGRHPIRNGMHVGVIMPWSRYGLPLEETTLPQALKPAGYRSALVGKWHLGHHDPAYLPTRRGFDHQYGHYVGTIDYFTHERDGGLDWHRDDKALRETGYSTELIAREAVRLIEEHDPKQPLLLIVAFNAPHSPLQVPEEYEKRYAHIADESRRKYAGMVACMDDAMARVLEALKAKGIAENTLVFYSSDNGGEVKHAADNRPLRGAKRDLHEGGVRVPAVAWWPGKLQAREVHEPIHVVDIFPTLLGLAGVKPDPKLQLDGRDVWPVLAEGKPSPHEDLLLNIIPRGGAIRKGPWKLVAAGKLPAEAGALDLELFRIDQDPEEKTNLAAGHPQEVQDLLARLNQYAREAVRPLWGNESPKGFKAPRVYGEPD